MFSQLVYSEGSVGEGNLILHDHCRISQSQNTKGIVVNEYSPNHKKICFFVLFFKCDPLICIGRHMWRLVLIVSVTESRML